MSHPGRMLRAWLAAGLLPLGAVAVGCSKGAFYVAQLAPTGLGRGDPVTIIPAQGSGDEESAALVKKAAACIQDALEETGWTGRMVPPGEFYQAAFPDLTAKVGQAPGTPTGCEPGSFLYRCLRYSGEEAEVPRGALSWERLVADVGFQERIAPLGLRYVILVTASEGRGPSRLQGGGGGGAPAIAFVWEWDTYARMTATVLDMKKRRVAGAVAARAFGKSSSGVVLLFFIFPIPVGNPSFPVGKVCGELREGVAQLLAGGNPPKP